MAETLLNQDAIAEWVGYSQQAKIEEWLKDHKIPYTYGAKNKVVTTLTAVNRGLMGESQPAEEIQFL